MLNLTVLKSWQFFPEFDTLNLSKLEKIFQGLIFDILPDYG